MCDGEAGQAVDDEHHIVEAEMPAVFGTKASIVVPPLSIVIMRCIVSGQFDQLRGMAAGFVPVRRSLIGGQHSRPLEVQSRGDDSQHHRESGE